MRHAYAAFAAFPSAAIAATFLITWINPTALGENMLSDLLGLMMLEFVLMHGGVFMSTAPLGAKTHKGRIAIVLAFAVLYSAFGIGLPLAMEAPWLILDFALLIAGKLMALRHLETEQQQKVAVLSSASGMLFFFAFVGFAWLFPFPHFGIDADYVRMPGNTDKLPNPQRIIGAAFLYWAAHAYTQYYLQLKFRPVPAAEPDPRVIIDVESRDPVDVA